MSSLTKLLYTDRQRQQIAKKGGLKTPMLMEHPIPNHFETACVSLRNGEPYLVGISEEQPVKTGFFELPISSEDQYQARLVEFLHEEGQRLGWGGMATVDSLDESLLEDVRAYFNDYELTCQHVFVGMVGFAALLTGGLLTLPNEVEDPSKINTDDLQRWMVEKLHVGKLGEIPVYYNEHLHDHVAFAAPQDTVGIMTRVGTHASVMLHNAECGMVIVRVGLESDGEGMNEEFSESDSAGVEDVGEAESSD